MEDLLAILSPHFDDAVLSCWSVLTAAVHLTVVNIFGGIPSADATLSRWDRLTRASSPRERALERQREDAEVLRTVGCEPVNLPFLDYTYRTAPQDTRPLVAALLERLEPGTRIYAPAGIGSHPDHVSVRAAAVSLLRRGYDVTLYADLPYAIHWGWPHWVAKSEPNAYLDVASDWTTELSYAEVAVSPEEAEVKRLEQPEIDRKLEAIRGYRTQYPGMRKHFCDDDSLAYELFWPLETTSVSRAEALRYEILWRAGVRRGSRLDQLMSRNGLRRLRPSANSRLGRLLRERAQRG